MKTVRRIFICFCLIAGSSLLFHSPIHLYDLITGAEVPEGFYITWPFIRILTEPFYAFTFYALTLERNFYLPAIISWIAWAVTALAVYCYLKKRTIKQFLKKLIYTFMLLATLFVFVALLPLPGPKLHKPQGYIAVDLHSHTISSHDNVSTAASSLKFHKYNGYDSFFVTEHNHTKGFSKFPEDAKFKQVFPGMQMQAKKGKISVLVLSAKEYDGDDYKDMLLEDMIKKAHDNEMLVIVPHWWKWHKFTFEELHNLGVDGFEIYNCGYRNFDENERQKMIDFSKDNGLIMIGSTDWHGWGYMSDVWTVFKGNTEENLLTQLAAKPEMKVVLYREKQSNSFFRFVFEPFAAFYYYIKSADLVQVFSLMFWTAVFLIIASSKAMVYIVKYLPVIMSVFFGILTVYYYILSLSVRGLNEIITVTVIPALIGFCVLWFITWRLNGKDIQ